MSKNKPSRGRSYIDFPKWLKNKRGNNKSSPKMTTNVINML